MAKRQSASPGDDESLESELRRKEATGEVTETTLNADDRVIARVTDGIYRQPASALRELISNAYDADATYIRIKTDAPRFETITVSDDGNGFTRAALVNLIKHIGGSLKRSPDGTASGVTDATNPDLSPGKRRLIGKIGIGLFAVAQLSRQFRIVTKTKGENKRRIAEVTLRLYDDPKSLADASAGSVKIWTEKAADKESHGTDIILHNVKRHTREILQSKDRWVRPEGDGNEQVRWKPPVYHVGTSVLKTYAEHELVEEREDQPKLPWEMSDTPETKFPKLYQAVLDNTGQSRSDPSLAEIFDTYFQTIWTLALSAPIDYVKQDPFTLSGEDGVHFFMLSNSKKGQSERIESQPGKNIGQIAKLHKRRKTGFEVFVDDIQLFRPISFLDFPNSTKASWTDPLMFIGKCSQDLTNFPSEATGGPLISFQAYFYWVPKIVPKENNGVLLRINDASGTLFDDTFMRYEIQEKMRLKQIVAEIFVEDGLDSALNIDRESFNFAHPHYQFIAQWTHSALRQIANRHKQLLKGAQSKNLARNKIRQSSLIKKVVIEAIEELGAHGPDLPAQVEIATAVEAQVIASKRRIGILAYDSNDVLPSEILQQAKGERQKADAELFAEKAMAVAQILDAYGILETLEYKDQERLLRAICRVFATDV